MNAADKQGAAAIVRPGYYAVIPADVRYDETLPPNAKLLYGEITALAGAAGFCYASNAHFASLYKMSERAISGLLGKLQEQKYIEIVLEKDPQTGQIVRRQIFLRVSSCDERPLENIFYTPRKYFREGVEKIFQSNNLSNNIPPISPPTGGDPPKGRKNKSRDYKSAADVLPERFEKFWIFYRTHVPPECNAGNRQKALRAWDKLAPSDELVTKMAAALAKQVKSQAWSTGVGVPHASTWLNNHGWEDDWGPVAGLAQEAADLPANEEGAEWVI